MTVAAQDPFNEYTANGATTAFAFEFEIKDADHLVVKSNGTVVPDSEYTVSGVSVQAGGTVTFDTAPVSGTVIQIQRAVPLERSIRYTTNGPFPATTVNLDFDLIWMVLQGLQAMYGGVLRVPYPNTVDEIPGEDDRGDRLLGFDTTSKEPVVSSFTMTQVASAIAAAYEGAAGPLDALTFIQAGTGAVSRTGQNKARELFTSRDFGATVDDSADDATELQAHHDAAGTQYTLSYGNGIHKIKPGGTSPYDFGNATNDVYRAVAITKSNLTLQGGRFHIVSRASVIGDDVQPAFATDKNMTVGAQENITFDGVVIDTENDSDATNSNQRGPYMTGVRGLRYRATVGLSSGNRRGYYSHVQNSNNVQVLGHYHRKNTGGFNFRYCDGVVLTDSIFDDFSEAVDFDGASWNAVGGNLVFRGTARTSQCLDLNSMVRASFSNIVAETTGNIANISYKKTTPPNFSDYVNNVTPSSLTPSTDVTVRGVKGKSIGNATNFPAFIGNEWTTNDHAGYEAVRNIMLDDWSLQDTGIIQVVEGKKITLQNFHMREVSNVPANYSAMYFRSYIGNNNELAWSDLDVTVRGASVEGCERGAARFLNPRRVVIDDFRSEDTDTAASGDADFIFNALEARGAQIVIDGLDTDRNVQISGAVSGISAWAADTVYVKNKVVSNSGKYYRCTTGGTSAAAGGPTTTARAITDNEVTWRWMPQPFEIVWGRKNKVGGQIVLVGDAHKYIQGESHALPMGTLAATGTVKQTLFVAKRRCYVARATLVASDGVTADAANYRTFAIKSIQAGAAATPVSSINTSATSWTAGVPVDGGFAAVESGAYLDPGDSMSIEISSTGTGVAVVGLLVVLEVLDC